MDPLSAIGLASAIVQFISFGLEVAKRLDEFNSADSNEVPRSLQAIRTQLPLLLNSLSRIKTDTQINKLDLDTKCILRGVISGCHVQVVEVETIINEISRTPGDAFKIKIKKVFASFKYDEKISQIERNLNTYISVLILHHVVDSTEVHSPPAEDIFFDIREAMVSPFVERPSLMKELENQFYDASRSRVKYPTILELAGAKGVGKTQLALAYCHTAHSLGQFRTVFWLDASTLENLCLGLESIYATIKRSTDGTRVEKISFVRGFLDDLWHPWLLVLDNYEPTELYNDIMSLLPTRGYGGILLITSSEENNGLGNVILVPKFVSIQDQRQLNSILTQEVQNENFEGIKDLVNQGADVDSLIWEQWPCLHRAALFGLEDAVSLFLERGANPNPPNVNIRKPLYWAANKGNAAVCRLLLDNEDATGNFSKPVDIQAAFNIAAEKGSLDAMRLLLSRREVAINNKNQYDKTPVQHAAKEGHVEMLNFLIEQGALLEDQSQGEQALLDAASAGNFEIVKILSSEGKVGPNIQDKQGVTALCHAAGLRDDSYKETGEEMAMFLLERGADPNLGDSDAPLHKAAVHDHPNIIRLLLKYGADPTKDCNGWDPLTKAIKYKSPNAMGLLIQTGTSDPVARTAWLERGLRYACRAGDREAVMQLLTAGANIDAVEVSGSPKGATPLLLAMKGGHVKTAQFLVRRKAKQDLADENGHLPLPWAAECGYDGLIRDLIRAGGDPNMKSGPNEDTPLLLAAAKKTHAKVVKVLLENGADRMLENKFGDIALDVAEENGNKEVVELLES